MEEDIEPPTAVVRTPSFNTSEVKGTKDSPLDKPEKAQNKASPNINPNIKAVSRQKYHYLTPQGTINKPPLNFPLHTRSYSESESEKRKLSSHAGHGPPPPVHPPSCFTTPSSFVSPFSNPVEKFNGLEQSMITFPSSGIPATISLNETNGRNILVPGPAVLDNGILRIPLSPAFMRTEEMINPSNININNPISPTSGDIQSYTLSFKLTFPSGQISRSTAGESNNESYVKGTVNERIGGDINLQSLPSLDLVVSSNISRRNTLESGGTKISVDNSNSLDYRPPIITSSGYGTGVGVGVGIGTGSGSGITSGGASPVGTDQAPVVNPVPTVTVGSLKLTSTVSSQYPNPNGNSNGSNIPIVPIGSTIEPSSSSNLRKESPDEYLKKVINTVSKRELGKMLSKR